MEYSNDKCTNNTIMESDNEGTLNISIFEAPENDFVFYDRTVDMQGTVPGCTLGEAEIAFEKKYGISLQDKDTE